MTGVTLAQLEALAAKAPPRSTHRGSPALTAGDVRERARAYVLRIPGAVSGQHGHDRTFYAASRLVRGFGLDPDAAYPILAEWNQTCDPPWSEHDLRRKLEQAARQPGPRDFLLNGRVAPSSSGNELGKSPKVLRNYFADEVADGETTRRVLRGRPLPAVAEDLEEMTHGWPRRVGDQLFVLGADGEPLHLQSTESLFAWIGTALASTDRTAGDPVDWSGRCGASKAEFRAYLQQNAERYDAVELVPHEPPLPSVYYVPRPVVGGDGKALAELLAFFRPATAEDGDLLQAFAMTLVWGGEAGQRPCWLFTAEDDDEKAGRGVGKTRTVEYISRLVGGCVLVLQSEEFAGVVTRLLSPDATGRRCVLIDNIKSTRFSWAELEAFVTSSTVSGRALYRGEGTKPNHFNLCLTGNKLSVSSDLAGRCVVVKLRRPDYGPGWDADVTRFLCERRWEIIGDLVAALRQPVNPVYIRSRWGQWQDEVLGRLPEPDAVQRVINERSEAADDDHEEAASIAEAARQLVSDRLGGYLPSAGKNPATLAVLIEAKPLADVVGPLIGKEKSGTNNISRVIGMYAIPELRKSDRKGRRLWLWTGSEAPAGTRPTFIISATSVEEVG